LGFFHAYAFASRNVVNLSGKEKSLQFEESKMLYCVFDRYITLFVVSLHTERGRGRERGRERESERERENYSSNQSLGTFLLSHLLASGLQIN
jgi:hypothetical protein